MPNQSQFNAIKNKASSDTLMSKLLAGRTAAASFVKNPNMPTNEMPPIPTPPAVVQRPSPPQPAPAAPPPAAPTNTAIKSHSVTQPDGSTVTQTYHKPEEGKVAPKAATPAHDIKLINGLHHVPFKAADGTIKYINAKGGII